MILYACVKKGVYRHQITGIFDSENMAVAHGTKLLNTEPDIYHEFEILKYNLNEAVEDGELVRLISKDFQGPWTQVEKPNIINIKALSVNQLYSGRRYRTVKYKQYKHDLLTQLSKINMPRGKIDLNIIFYLSNPGQDLDGCFKGFIDVLQSAYEFNDNLIYKLSGTKRIVKKGDERIEFNMSEFADF